MHRRPGYHMYLEHPSIHWHTSSPKRWHSTVSATPIGHLRDVLWMFYQTVIPHRPNGQIHIQLSGLDSLPILQCSAQLVDMARTGLTEGCWRGWYTTRMKKSPVGYEEKSPRSGVICPKLHPAFWLCFRRVCISVTGDRRCSGSTRYWNYFQHIVDNLVYSDLYSTVYLILYSIPLQADEKDLNCAYCALCTVSA